MNYIEFFEDRFDEFINKEAIIYKDTPYTYQWIIERLSYWEEIITKSIKPRGAIVAIESDFSADSICLFMALAKNKHIIIPLSIAVESKKKQFFQISQTEFIIKLTNYGHKIIYCNRKADHELYKQLRKRNHPGLVVFSSGSTGDSKAAVHDLVPIFQKFKTKRHQLRT